MLQTALAYRIYLGQRGRASSQTEFSCLCMRITRTNEKKKSSRSYSSNSSFSTSFTAVYWRCSNWTKLEHDTKQKASQPNHPPVQRSHGKGARLEVLIRNCSVKRDKKRNLPAQL